MAVATNRWKFCNFYSLSLWLILRHANAQSFDLESEYRRNISLKLFKQYDKYRVPAKGSDAPVNVSLTMWPYDILYVKESQSSMKFSGWIDMRWNDYQLTWDPAANGNVTHVFVPASQLWLPSIDIYYSKEEGAQIKKCEHCYAKVDNDGSILFGHYFAFCFPCRINVKYFPYDQQSCKLQLANWFLDGSLHQQNLDLSVFLPNEEWDLLNITVVRSREFFNYGHFPILSYELFIRRKPFYYILNLVLPTFAIAITAVIGYHCPTTGLGVHQEKVKIGLTTILSILILQLGVSDKMPKTTNAVPLLNIYYTSMVCILAMAIISSSLIILIEKQGIYGRPVPRLLKRIFMRNKSFKVRLRELKATIVHPKWNCSSDANFRYGHITADLSTVNNRCHEGRNITSLDSLIWKPREAKGPKKSVRVEELPPLSGDLKVLESSLDSIKKILGGMELRQKEKTKKAQIVREWSNLADQIEKISLLIFLTACFSSLTLFFFHGWY